MKIALNCAFLQPKGGGIKEYMVNLVTNLSKTASGNDYVVYVLEDFMDYAKDRLKEADVRIKPIPFKTGSITNKVFRSLFESFFWRKEEKLEKWDLFHSPFFHAPSLSHTKTLLTIHDLRFYRYPETYHPMRAAFLKRAVKRSVRKASHIITISDFTKAEVMEAYGVEESRITTIHEAINPSDFSTAKCAGKGPDELERRKFILSVGHIEPRKNYDRLIEAYNKMKASDSRLKDHLLVIVGKKECHYAKTLELMEKTPGVVYMNFVSHEILIWLYRNASLFAFPSVYEGFGFPPLEAAALGVPSAVSNISSIPEVCRDKVIYFDPFDTDDMAEALTKGLIDNTERNRLISALPDMFGAFSWEKNAAETLEIYKSLTARK